MSESMKEITKRVLNERSRVPIKRYSDGDLVVACAYRKSGGDFVINVNENIWFNASDTFVQITYKDADAVASAGWEVD